MSELTKQQLTVENNSSFPNNNTGFITPTLLRTFNQNMIDSMVDEVQYNADSGSWEAEITALQQFSSSLDANFTTNTELSASASTLQNNINTKLNTSSFNAYTASQNPGAVTGSLLLTASAVSNVITFTKGDGTTFPVTVGSVIDSSSLVSTSSFNAYTASAATNTSASINAATSSLSASLTVMDNQKLFTSSFNTYTQSVTAQFAGIGQALAGKLNTSSLSVPQNITGSVIISGSSTGGNGETLRLIGGPNPATDLALHVLSGSVEITTPQGNGAHFYSNAPITSSNLRINGTAVVKDLIVSGTWGGSGSGSLFVENSITASTISASNISALSASITYLNVIYQTSSVVFSSGSNIFGDELSDFQILSGSVKVQGSLTVNGVNALLVGQTASYASASISSSFATFAETASEARNVVVIARNGNPSSLPAGTVVHITGASGDNPIFNTASFTSEALSSNTLGILRNSLASGADGEVIVNGIVLGVNTDPALGYVAGDIIYLSSSGQFTRVQPQAPQQIVTLGQVLRAQQNNGSIYVNISNGWELDELHNVAINGVVDGDLLVYRSGTSLWTNSSSAELGLVNTSSFNSYTSSESSNVSASINSATSSLSASLTLTDNSKLNTGSFNTYTSSVSIQIAALGTTKVNYNSPVNPQSITGSLIISGTSTNGNGETLRLIGGPNPATDLALHILSGSFELTTPQGNGAHFYTNAPITSSALRINGTAVIKDLFVSGTWGGSGSGSLFVENSITASVISASNIYADTVFANVLNGTASFANNAGTAQTASYVLNAVSASYVLQSVSSSFASFANTASFALNVPTINTSSLATTGSNIFIGNQTITGSVILSSSADIELTVIGNSIISGNLLVTGSNINLEVDPPALSIGVTNVKTLLDATASGVVTTEDIYRTGAGPTGDLSGVRLQTLSGSDTTGDTLLSRISTGVNRHTSTAMTGSVVNSIITSTWATGSGGTRVAYSSNVIANAQSASSTLTLNAGNASANYGGGTASLLAGRVNIGTTSATITSTGSFNHLGAFVTSQGITSNNGGITATSGSINGDFRVSGSVNISGSNPTQLWTSGGLNLSGSLISNITDIYTGSNNANFIVTLGSASMASLIAAGTTNPNTLYFVI